MRKKGRERERERERNLIRIEREDAAVSGCVGKPGEKMIARAIIMIIPALLREASRALWLLRFRVFSLGSFIPPSSSSSSPFLFLSLFARAYIHVHVICLRLPLQSAPFSLCNVSRRAFWLNYAER
jgi:hypothetical protein